MIQRILMTLLLAGLTAVAGAETVYKWSDSSGQIHYTDVPPRQADAKILDVFEQSVGALDDGSQDSEEGYDEGADDTGDDQGDEQTTEAGSSTPPRPTVSDAMLAAARTDAERAKAEQCKLAQDRYKLYIQSRRLFREKDGKRVYLSDKELDEARAQAKQSVDDYCS